MNIISKATRKQKLFNFAASVSLSLCSAIPVQATALCGAAKNVTPYMDRPAVLSPVPSAAVNAPVILIGLHGFGLDKSSFSSLAGKLSDIGIPFYALDIRGFGSHSDEPIDFVKSEADVRQLLTTIRSENPASSIVLVGESMGGALALNIAACSPELLDGVISSEPAYKVTVNPVVYPLVFSNLLLRPKAQLRVPLSFVGRVSKDEDLVYRLKMRIAADRGYSASEMWRFRHLMKSVRSAAKSISTPVLFLQGDSDRLVSPAGTVALSKAVKTDSSRLVLFKGRGHLLLEEGQETGEVIQALTQFVSGIVSERAKLAYLASAGTKR